MTVRRSWFPLAALLILALLLFFGLRRTAPEPEPAAPQAAAWDAPPAGIVPRAAAAHWASL
jgi:hypothetical protein